jgi:ABC-type branched-subunit amino acid transport system substrate-binding protein
MTVLLLVGRWPFVLLFALLINQKFYGSLAKTIVRLGFVAPLTSYDGSVVNILGAQYVTTFLLAVSDLNREFAEKNVTVLATVRNARGSFAAGVSSALDMTYIAFNQSGVHGIIGGRQNDPTLAVAYIIKETNLVQMSYGADLTTLSHNDMFTSFLRDYPSAAYQAHALGHLIPKMGLLRAAVIYSTDTYGIDSLAEFEAATDENDLTIITRVGVTLGQGTSSYEGAIAKALVYKPRVFAFLMSSPTEASAFIEAAYQSGLIDEDSTIFLTGEVTSSLLWSSMDEEIAARLFPTVGVFGVLPADSDWKVTEIGKDFIARYRALPNTVTILSNGTETCDSGLSDSLDDDGAHYLYKVQTTSGYTCTGFDYSRFAADGSDIDDYNAYVYDATISTVFGILSTYEQTDGSYSIPTKICGMTVRGTMTSSNFSLEVV